MSKPFQSKMYYALAVDPIHVGTGGYRLGRVDNTIIREPATNLPKIPGSSISGVCRANTAMHPLVDKYATCAGKGGKNGSEHCCGHDCPVCVAFGFSNGSDNKSFHGIAQFSDARILFFPVHSMQGPVWITSLSILKCHDFSVTMEKTEWQKFKYFSSDADPGRLNFGWIMLESAGKAEGKTLQEAFALITSELPELKDRLFLLSDKLFSRIVNDNLEVRTSVSIDPKTGAAADKALFTYEAIPRATVLWFEITYNNPDFYQIDGQSINLTSQQVVVDPFGRTGLTTNNQIGLAAYYVEQGLSYFESLGLGGMNTRGFGRARILHGGIA